MGNSNTDVSYSWTRKGTAQHRIVLLDGPNMPNLGARSKKIYGQIQSITELQQMMISLGEQLGVEVTAVTSNYTGEILDAIHETAATADGYLVNPAGDTVTGEKFVHALIETERPWIEIHFSNIQAAPYHPRGLPTGPWSSRFTPYAHSTVMGLREHSYVSALIGLVSALDDPNFTA